MYAKRGFASEFNGNFLPESFLSKFWVKEPWKGSRYICRLKDVLNAWE